MIIKTINFLVRYRNVDIIFLQKAKHETQLMKMEEARLKQLEKIKEEQGWIT